MFFFQSANLLATRTEDVVELPAISANSDHPSTPSVVTPSPVTSASTVDIVAASTSDVQPSVSIDCDTDPLPLAAPLEFDIELPAVADSNQSVVEYLISLPDDQTGSPAVQCLVDGVAVLPEDIRPYPVAERVNFSTVKRRSKAKSATLITGSPFKAQLMATRMNKGSSKRQTTNKGADKKKRGLNLPELPQKRQKMSQKVKNSRNKATGVENDVEENDECGNCGFKYGEPNDPLIADDWLKCVNCAKWCHFSCGTARKNTFNCYKCM